MEGVTMTVLGKLRVVYYFSLLLASCLLLFAFPEITQAYFPGIGSAPNPIDWKTFMAPQPQVKHPVTVGVKGALQYSFKIESPPALLAPSLSLDYHSGASFDKEMPLGWSLGGILEIKRPHYRAYRAEDGYNDELLLTGPLNALLFSYGGDSPKLYEADNNGTEIQAYYYQDSDKFVVYDSSGLTWLLTAKDNGSGTKHGTAFWRAESVTDLNGNKVIFNYNSHNHLSSVEYGGTESDSSSHHIKISFKYKDRDHKWSDASHGFLESTEEILERIIVKGNNKVFCAYVLTTDTVEDAGDHLLLTSIQKYGSDYDEGTGTGTSLPPIEFEYSPASYESTSGSSTVVAGPPDLGRIASSSCAYTDSGLSCLNLSGTSSSNVSRSINETWQEAILIDMNRDGWLDYLETDGTNWTVRYQDRSSTVRDFSSPVSITGPPGELFINQWISESFSSDSEKKSSHDSQNVMIADLNGDGYPDLISSLEEYYYDTGARLLENNSKRWGVYYGTGDGFETEVTWEQANSAPIEGRNPPGSAAETIPQVWKTLLDYDGDGDLDVIQAKPGARQITLYEKLSKGNGWDSKPQTIQAPWLSDMKKYSSLSGSIGGLQHADLVASSCTGLPCIEYTNQWGGFVDMNADGFQDYVVSAAGAEHVGSPADTWSIYYGNGTGWEQNVTWDFDVSYMNKVFHGDSSISPSQELIGLMDINGDNLPDLVHYDPSHWYENEKDGLDTFPRSLASWWPSDVTESEIELRSTTSSCPSLYFKIYSSAPGVSGAYNIVHKTSTLVRDFDYDGLLDSLETSTSSGSTDIRINYSVSTPPNLLVTVHEPGGRETNIAYEPSSTMEPAGDFSQTQYMGQGLVQLVEKVKTTDGVTGTSGLTTYSYENGHFSNGLYYGFEDREVKYQRDGLWLSRVVETYDVTHRNYDPLLTHRETYTDFCHGFAPSFDAGCTSSSSLTYLRSEEDISYAYAGSGSKHYLPHALEKTEYGESAGSSASMRVDMSYNEYGFLENIYMDGDYDGFNHDKNDKFVSYDYTTNSRYDHMHRLAAITSYGFDPLNGLWREMGMHLFYYDGNGSHTDSFSPGNLTGERVFSGWYDGGESVTDESLSWEFGRGERGELTSITGPRGETTKYTYTFNKAVKKSETNHLGHKTKYTVDSFGRVEATTDANGVVKGQLFDALGRVEQEYLTDSKGKSYVTNRNSYVDSSLPFYQEMIIYDETGATVSQNYDVFDGGGKAMQKWTQDETGQYIIMDSLFNINGSLVQTSYPYVSGASSFSYSGLLGPSVLNKNYLDAFGIVREAYADVTLGINSTLVYLDQVRQQVNVDPVGYETTLTYDGYGRIVKVEAGLNSENSQLAEYAYDVFDNLVKFTDANGQVYSYSFDAARRLRQVTGSDIGTRTYTYDADLLIETVDSAGGYAQYEHDDLGRKVKTIVSDPLSSTGEIEFSVTYDTKWIGEQDEVTDPLGVRIFDYDSFGRITKDKRVFLDSTGAVVRQPEFSQNYNLLGKVVSQLFPSGKSYEYAFDYGWNTTMVETSSGLRVEMDYNIFGNLEGWQATLPGASASSHRYTASQITPLWQDRDSLYFTGTAISVGHDYDWLDNGLLASKQRSYGVSTSPVIATKTYTYDTLKRLTQVTPSSTSATNETFSFVDAVGNLSAQTDPSTGNIWSYASLATGNQLSSRSSSATTESFTYDDAGRLQTITDGSDVTEYLYLGNGRLRAVYVNGEIKLALDYDIGGKVIRRSFGDPDQPATNRSYHFLNWKYDERSAEQTEVFGADGNIFGAYVNASRQWYYKTITGEIDTIFDDNGIMLSSQEFSAYGESLTTLGSVPPDESFSFHGGTKETDLGLHAMGARHLNASLGAFLQPEPLLLGTLEQDNLADPLKLHPYRYARNAPSSLYDKTGTEGEEAASPTPPESGRAESSGFTPPLWEAAVAWAEAKFADPEANIIARGAALRILMAEEFMSSPVGMAATLFFPSSQWALPNELVSLSKSGRRLIFATDKLPERNVALGLQAQLRVEVAGLEQIPSSGRAKGCVLICGEARSVDLLGYISGDMRFVFHTHPVHYYPSSHDRAMLAKFQMLQKQAGFPVQDTSLIYHYAGETVYTPEKWWHKWVGDDDRYFGLTYEADTQDMLLE